MRGPEATPLRTSTAILMVALGTLPGCACDSVPSTALLDCQATEVLPDAVATDILFVVDDSGSMSEEQANLATNLGAFIDALVASPVRNDFRIGVTTSSVEEFTVTANAGRSYAAGPATGVPYPAGALVAVRTNAAGSGLSGSLIYDAALYPATGGWGGTRILEKSSPTLARDFKANVRVGIDGSGREQPFRAAQLALSDRLLDANAGFLRPGARLAIIFLTDEDDCSGSTDARVADSGQCHDMAVKNAAPPILDPPGQLASFLLGPVDGEIREVLVGAIAGIDPVSLAPSCGDAQCSNRACATAYDKGDRFVELGTALGGARMRLGSICDSSFRNSLAAFAEAIMPTELPLSGAPADWRMLVVTVARAAGGVATCTVAPEGASGQASADAVYSPPRFGRPAMITFQNGCKLGLGDRIDVRVVCAG